MLDDTAFLVLNAIYLKKMAGPDDLAAITGLPAAQVQAHAVPAVRQGLLLDLGGNLMLQPDGTAAVVEYYRDRYAQLRGQEQLADWYARFEVLNTQFIKYVTEWQTSDGDPRVQERMLRVVERLIKALAELTEGIPRYRRYIERFEHGMALVDQGQRDFVCSPRVDSLHNVWFEFHEDILAVLGRPRDT